MPQKLPAAHQNPWWLVLRSRVMWRPAARVILTRARQPLGFGPNGVLAYCFWVAFHIYRRTPPRARWEAPIRLFPVRGPPGKLQNSLPRALPACALAPEAPAFGDLSSKQGKSKYIAPPSWICANLRTIYKKPWPSRSKAISGVSLSPVTRCRLAAHTGRISR